MWDVDEPDTVAVSGEALADLLATSIESTVVIESTVAAARDRTERTIVPPPSSRREIGSISFAPVAYTPRGVVVAPPPARFHPALRTAISLAVGLGVGLLAAVGATQHTVSAAAATTARVVRSASDEKVAIDAALHDKAAAKKRRMMMIVPMRPVAPAAPAPSLDALGDAQLGRPF